MALGNIIKGRDLELLNHGEKLKRPTEKGVLF